MGRAVASRKIFALLVMLLATACQAEVSPTLQAQISASPDLPRATLTPSPEPTAEPTAVPRPSSLWWEPVAPIDTGAFPGGGISGILGFDAGYVAWGTFGLDNDAVAFAAWFSPDGAAWQRTLTAEQVAPCPNWTPRSSLEGFYDGATNGRQVILVGSTLDSPNRQPCDEIQPITLATSDGVTWVRSAPSRKGGADQVWSTATGWQSASSFTGAVWTSVDGLTWQPAGSIKPPRESLVRMAGSADGTLLAARGDQLLVSTDGSTWEPIHTLPPGFVAYTIAPPSRSVARWTVAIGNYRAEEGRMLSSADLRRWDSNPLPNPETAWIAPITGGMLVQTYWQGRVTGCGDQCPNYPQPVISWSTDGHDWVDLSAPAVDMGGLFVGVAPADGPVGVLAPAGHSSAGALIMRLVIE